MKIFTFHARVGWMSLAAFLGTLFVLNHVHATGFVGGGQSVCQILLGSRASVEQEALLEALMKAQARAEPVLLVLRVPTSASRVKRGVITQISFPYGEPTVFVKTWEGQIGHFKLSEILSLKSTFFEEISGQEGHADWVFHKGLESEEVLPSVEEVVLDLEARGAPLPIPSDQYRLDDSRHFHDPEMYQVASDFISLLEEQAVEIGRNEASQYEVVSLEGSRLVIFPDGSHRTFYPVINETLLPLVHAARFKLALSHLASFFGIGDVPIAHPFRLGEETGILVEDKNIIENLRTLGSPVYLDRNSLADAKALSFIAGGDQYLARQMENGALRFALGNVETRVFKRGMIWTSLDQSPWQFFGNSLPEDGIYSNQLSELLLSATRRGGRDLFQEIESLLEGVLSPSEIEWVIFRLRVLIHHWYWGYLYSLKK
jgi:hypothetical protein